MHLYALLIGIDQYHPESKVNALSGCKKDTLRMQKMLHDFYSSSLKHDSIQVLTDEMATRSNIIDKFTMHLSKATCDDVILIYFAGHGARSKAATELKQYSSDGKEEGWVLYDSRTQGNFDLSDKEIAFLLKLLYDDTGATICLISDSCYAGTITRTSNQGERYTSGNDNERPLDSYLNGEIECMFKATGGLQLPVVPHVSITASSKKEVAFEDTTGSGGLFTTALLNTIYQAHAHVTYTQLFLGLNKQIYHLTLLQNPQIDVCAGFDLELLFLVNTKVNTNLLRFPIVWSTPSKQWLILAGEIGGLLKSNNTGDLISVFEHYLSNNVVAYSELMELGVQKSEILPNKLDLNKDKIYWGEFERVENAQYLSLYVEEHIEELLYLNIDSKDLYYSITTSKKDASLSLSSSNSTYDLVDCISGFTLAHFSRFSQSEIQRLHLHLKHLYLFYCFKNSNNNNSTIIYNNIFFNIIFKSLDKWEESGESEVTINTKKSRVIFRFTFHHEEGCDLYATLIYFTPRYGIEVLFHDEIAIKPCRQQILYENRFFVNENMEKESEHFKLIISKKYIHPELIQKPDLIPGTPINIDSFQIKKRGFEESELVFNWISISKVIHLT